MIVPSLPPIGVGLTREHDELVPALQEDDDGRHQASDRRPHRDAGNLPPIHSRLRLWFRDQFVGLFEQFLELFGAFKEGGGCLGGKGLLGGCRRRS